jgi:hypothetical protein
MNKLTQNSGIKGAIILIALFFFNSVSFSQIPYTYNDLTARLKGKHLFKIMVKQLLIN